MPTNRKHILSGAVALLAITGTALTSEAATDPPAAESVPLSVESLAGIWKVDSESSGGQTSAVTGLLMAMGPDGTFAFDNGGYLDTTPFVAGTHELDGDIVDLNVEEGGCTVVPDYRAELTSDGTLRVVYTETGDNACDVGVGTEWTLIRLSPSSAAASAISSSTTGGSEPAPPAVSLVTGIWLREGSGQLLRTTADHTYAIDDSGLLGIDPDDTGTWDVEGDAVTLVSAGSASCREGDTHVLDDVLVDSVRLTVAAATFTRRVRAVAADPECRIYGTGDQTWIRVSP